MSQEASTNPGMQDAAERTVGLAFEPFPEIEALGGFPDENGVYPSSDHNPGIVKIRSDSDIDARPMLSQQEVDEANEVALHVDKLETKRARKVGALASIGAAYEGGHVSDSVYDAAQQEIETAVARLDKKLGTKYEKAESEATQASTRASLVDSDIEALKRRS